MYKVTAFIAVCKVLNSIKVLEMLMIANQEFPMLHKTQRFTTMLAIACHYILSWARWIQFIFQCLSSLISSITLPSYPYLGHSNGFFPSKFPTKILYTFIISPKHATYTSHPALFDNVNYNWWREQIMKLIINTGFSNLMLPPPEHCQSHSHVLSKQELKL
jgi:hypothetical protein